MPGATRMAWDWRSAERAWPDDPGAGRLAVVRMSCLGDLSGATDQAMRIVAASPSNADGRVLLSFLYRVARKPRRALTEAETAVQPGAVMVRNAFAGCERASLPAPLPAGTQGSAKGDRLGSGCGEATGGCRGSRTGDRTAAARRGANYARHLCSIPEYNGLVAGACSVGAS